MCLVSLLAFKTVIKDLDLFLLCFLVAKCDLTGCVNLLNTKCDLTP